ncbi:MAG: aldose 1-epimerase, partial [Phycisphaerae bacterium]|nr:aldose 1-epimerase [Phycisphaerae bacterium]
MSEDRFGEGALEVRHIRVATGGHEVIAGIQPHCGANLVTLKVDGQEYIHYDEAALRSDERRYTGCFIMFPTPCRVPNGRYEFQGRTITQNKAGRLITIHGLVRDEAFDLTATDGGMALKLDITPEGPVYEAFPFPGRLSISLKLVETGLEYSFSYENRGETPAPVGFGVHPFWRIPAKREDVWVKIPCDESMVLEDLIPTGATQPVAGTVLDLREPRCLEGLEPDNVLLGRHGP